MNIGWRKKPSAGVYDIVLSILRKKGRSIRGIPGKFATKKLWVWAANDARSQPGNFLVFLFELFVAQCILVKSPVMHSG